MHFWGYQSTMGGIMETSVVHSYAEYGDRCMYTFAFICAINIVRIRTRLFVTITITTRRQFIKFFGMC